MWWANQALGRDARADKASGERIISNVVMMGMGEPLTNFDNVVTALCIMLDDHAYGLSRRRVTVSTSGIVPNIDRLRAECPVALAVSLHAPNDELRDVLVPINRKYPLRELMAACRRYVDGVAARGLRERIPREVAHKWQRQARRATSLHSSTSCSHGVNDSSEHARQLIALARDVPCKFNLIPFNPFPNSGYQRSGPERIRAFQEMLMEAGDRDGAQDARRRHRRRLRAARGPGAGSHSPRAAPRDRGIGVRRASR